MRNRVRVIAGVAVPVVGLAAVGLATPAQAATATCFGKHATITSSKGGTVNGTNGNDVIIATGKGVKVNGLGGNDLICTKQSSSVDGGSGNDKIQVGGGTAKGGSGNDQLTADPKAVGRSITLDGGSGTDTYTATKVAKVTIKGTAGELVNGYPVDVSAPQSGAPTFGLTYGFDSASNVSAATQSASSIETADDLSDDADAVHLYHPRAAIGHRLASWSVDFGDGFTQSGKGGPPDVIDHLYVTPGAHVVIAKVTDDAGRTGTRGVTVTAGGAPAVALTNAGTTGGVTTLTIATTPATATAVQSWALTFDDGSAPISGQGQPPASVAHTYAPGRFSPRIVVVSTTGQSTADAASVNTDDSQQHLTAFLTTPAAVPGARPSFTAGGFSFPTIANPSATVGAGDTVTLDLAASLGFDSYDVDWGDAVTQTTTGSNLSHTYFSAGNRAVTITAHPSGGGADVVLVKALPVTGTQLVAQLSVPSDPAEGKVTISTKGSKATGTSAWILDFGDGTAPLTGVGLPKTTYTHTYASGIVVPTLRLDSGLSAADTAAEVLVVTSTRSRIVDTTVASAHGSGTLWAPTIAATNPTAEPNADFGLVARFAPKRKANLATVAYGDGRGISPAPGFADGVLSTSDVRNTYSTPGEYDVQSVIKDDKSQRDSSWTHVSVAGLSSLVPASGGAVTTGTAGAITIGLTLGANEQVAYWGVDWADDQPVSQGFGAVPATLSHTWTTAGTRSVTVRVQLVHGGVITKRVNVTVNAPSM